MRIAVFLSAGLLLQGCATVGTFQRASTVGKGNIEGGFEASGMGAASSVGAGVVPVATGSLRYGVSDDFDIGARFGSTGLELLTKYQFTDGEDGPILSLAPTASWFGLSFGDAAASYWALGVPLLIGIPSDNGSELVIGPKLLLQGFSSRAGDTRATAMILSGGASFGYALQAGNTFTLMPEISAVYPFGAVAGTNVGGESVSGAGVGAGDALIFQAGLGFSWGPSDR